MGRRLARGEALDVGSCIAGYVVGIPVLRCLVADQAQYATNDVANHGLMGGRASESCAGSLHAVEQLVDIMPFGLRNDLAEELGGCAGAFIACDLSPFEEAG